MKKTNKQISHVGVGVGIWFSKAVYQLSFNIFILRAISKFKIEKIKLPLTMPHPQADLLLQTPHHGEDKIVKCPINAQGVDARSWN